MKLSDLGTPRLEPGISIVTITSVSVATEGRNGAYKSPMVSLTFTGNETIMVPSRGHLVMQLVQACLSEQEIEKANSLLELCGLMTGRVCSVSMQQQAQFVNPIGFSKA